MKRKIIMIAALSFVLIGLVYAFTSGSETKAQAMTARLQSDNQLTTENLSDYLELQTGKHVFYLDDGSTDAEYISTSLLIPLGLEFENALPEIEPIAFKDSKMSVVGIKKSYKVESLPALVIVETVDDSGAFNVISSISYDKSQPFDSKQLREWFHDNGLWNAPYASAN